MRNDIPIQFGNTRMLQPFIESELPERVSWLPQTLGWKILALLVGAFLLRHLINAVKQWQHNRYRREAIAALNILTHQDLPYDGQYLFTVMKKTALYAYPHHSLSTCHGKDWADFLNSTSTSPLETSTVVRWQQSLLDPAYIDPLTKPEFKALTQWCQCWVLNHIGERHV